MRRFLIAILLIVLIAGGYSAWALSRPLPSLAPHSLATAPLAAQTVSLPWPGFGEAALGAENFGLLKSHGEQTPAPTASTAKLITALAVLKRKPLEPGQQGPMLTIGNQDIQFYDNYVAQQGSVVPVNFGEQISEYQVLQAMMLPSANNLADSLAAWAFGSTSAYVNFANSFVRQLGMNNTHVADASGFSPQTTSTATDLVRLGLDALKNPVLKSIVSQPTATIPVAGTINNVDSLLGHNGINGIKTGNTTQAGGVYVSSATYTVSGHSVTIVTAIMDAPDLNQALNATPPLLTAAQNGFAVQTVIKPGAIVGYYNTPWHTSDNAIASRAITTFDWKEQPDKPVINLQTITTKTPRGAEIGIAKLNNSSHTKDSPLSLQAAVQAPSWQWRLMHP